VNKSEKHLMSLNTISPQVERGAMPEVPIWFLDARLNHAENQSLLLRRDNACITRPKVKQKSFNITHIDSSENWLDKWLVWYDGTA
jgi:hypothetical protein